jgi:FkbM family methyltransferase
LTPVARAQPFVEIRFSSSEPALSVPAGLDRRLLERLPVFDDVRTRRRAVQAARLARRTRRHVAERVGMQRYSHPEISALRPYLDFDGGFFVEAGANDGFRQSNTYFLERYRGWRGILIEPIPELYRRCLRERPRSRCVNAALVAPSADPTVTMRYGDLGSHIPSGSQSLETADACWGWDTPYDVTVPARTLNEILLNEGNPRIDFVSLDLEGHEVAALRGFDLALHRPKLILIEAFQPGDALAVLLATLGGHYEAIGQLTHHDILFRAL